MEILARFMHWMHAIPLRIAFVTLALVLVFFASWWFLARWFVLSELEAAFPSVSIEQKLSEAVQNSRRALPAPPDASILLSSPLSALVPSTKPDFPTAITFGESGTIEFSNLHVSGARQQAHINADFLLALPRNGLSLKGNLSIGAIPHLAQNSELGEWELVISPTIESWKFKSVRFNGLPLNFANVVNLLTKSLHDSTDQISEHLGAVRTPLSLPLKSQSISIPVGDGVRTEIETPAYKLARGSTIIDSDMLSIVVQLESSDKELSTLSTLAPDDTDDNFALYKSEFKEVLARSFQRTEMSSSAPTLHISESFLKTFLSIVPGKPSTKENLTRSLETNFARLAQSSYLDSGFFISSGFIEKAIKEEIGIGDAERNDSDRTTHAIKAFSVEVDRQLIRVSGQFEEFAFAPGATISGRVKGSATPIVLEDSVRFFMAFDSLNLDYLSISGWQANTVQVLLLLGGSQDVLLTAANALLPEVSFKLQPIRPGKIKLLPSTGSTSVTFKPDELLLPDIHPKKPVVIIEPSGMRVLLSMTEERSDQVAPTAVPQKPVSFDEFKEGFDKQWNNKVDPDFTSGEDVFAFVQKNAVASYLESAWPQTGISAEIIFSETSRLKKTHHRIGHIDTNLECKERVCNLGTCRRNSCPVAECKLSGGCGRVHGECDKNCGSTCIWKACVKDPVCVAAEAVCNVHAETRAAACEAKDRADYGACTLTATIGKNTCEAAEETAFAACKVFEATKHTDCQRLAHMENAACSIKKAALNVVSDIGEIGTTSGSVSYRGGGTISLNGIRVSESLDQILLDADINVNGVVEADVTFVPDGGIGHVLGCVSPIRFQPTLRAAMHNAFPVNARAHFIGKEIDERKLLGLKVQVPELRSSGQMHPAPADALFKSNPEMIVQCPFLASASQLGSLLGKGLVVLTGKEVSETIEDDDVAGAFVDTRNFLVQFGGGVAHLRAETQFIEIDLPEMDLDISGRMQILAPHNHHKAIVYKLVSAH